jgi:hypothetical protein
LGAAGGERGQRTGACAATCLLFWRHSDANASTRLLRLKEPGAAAFLPSGARGAACHVSTAGFAPVRLEFALFFSPSATMAAPAKTVKDVDSHKFVQEYANYLRSTGKARCRSRVCRVPAARPPGACAARLAAGGAAE